MRIIAAALALVAVGFAAGPVTAQSPPLVLETVGNRADLVSGGDVLVRTNAPPGAVLSVNGAAVPGALRPAPDGRGQLAMVEGLPIGPSRVAVSVGGRSARLVVTNHPSGGPLFSGPQIMPWPCREGATSAKCDRPTSLVWHYMPTAGAREFKVYDPARPATDVAQVTTSEGLAVPYIVRVESFTQNRSGVSVATLFDPKAEWTPFAPQRHWNRGVHVLQGAGCGTGFGEQPAGSPLNANALGKGFIVVTVALLHNTINCNPIVQAEAAVMAKEHVAETYGTFDFVFGMGGSGGAISQIMDQNAYPGLYDGLILAHLFADSDASRTAAYDCLLVREAMGKPGVPAFSEAQRAAILGMLSGCASSPDRWQIYKASVGTSCNVPADQKYDAARNPRGVRCTLQDYQVNQVGRRPDGFANGRLDNEGVQYGLAALKAETITPAQFVSLNAAIGGHDIDMNPIPRRTVADRAGLGRLYATGVANTQTNLAGTAIIETRRFVTDFHQPFHAVMVRARLDRAQGHHDNYALWRTPSANDPGLDAAFDVMVAWLKAIKADTGPGTRAQKVVRNRPPLARDRCLVGGQDRPLSDCPRPPALARVLAGAPDANDSGKCHLKRLNAADYAPVTFREEEWASLRQTFPTGVCDYARPMVDFRPTIPWLTYSGDGRFRPLPPAPRSN